MINLSSRKVRYFALLLVAIVMVMCSNQTFAIGVASHSATHTSSHSTASHVTTATALRVATTPRVATPIPPAPVTNTAPQTAAQPTASMTCFWQFPNRLLYVNLYTVPVVRVGGRQDDYYTRVYYSNTYDDIPIKPGEDIRIHINMIQKRLKECSEGK